MKTHFRNTRDEDNEVDKPYIRPSIDHSILSPSGTVSKRTRVAALTALKLASFDLFGPNGLERPGLPTQPTEKERLIRDAKMWNDLADYGMGVRKYRKMAQEALAKASLLGDGK